MTPTTVGSGIININVTNVDGRILHPLPQNVLDDLDMALSYEVPGSYYSDLFQRGIWDGRNRLFREKTQSFPTGLLPKVREVLDKHNIKYEYIDKRDICDLGKEIPLHMSEGDELYPFQQEAINSSVEKTRGIVRVGTGGGKSVILSGIIAKTNLSTLVLIHRKDIFYQLRDMLKFHLRTKIGSIGCGENDIQKFNIGMVATLAKTKDNKVKEFLANVRCLIVDECHQLGAKQAYSITKMCKAAFIRIGTTATAFRYDDRDFYLQAPTAEKIVDIGPSDLIKQGYLVPPHIFVIGISKIPDLSYMTYQECYDQGIVNNTERNEVIVEVCNYLQSKKLTVLVAITRVEHGKILVSMLHERYPHIKSVFVHGGDEDFLRKDILEDLRAKKLDIVIATSIYKEGIDVRSLDCLLNAKCQDSGVDSYQLIGRVLRKSEGKKFAIVVDFNDKSKYLHKHGLHRRDIYESEPEFKTYTCKDVLQFEKMAEKLIEESK